MVSLPTTSPPNSVSPAPPAGPDLFDLVHRPPPAGGIRRFLYRVSRGRINPGPSRRDQARAELVARVRTPVVAGRRRIAMISLKGGVGKTTTTVMLGHTFASLRGDGVIAIDANPDAGNLASRIRRETDATVRDFVRGQGNFPRYADVRRFTSQADSRLEVLAAEQDPALSEAFSGVDYTAALGELERFYPLVLTDCGTGILHDAMTAVLYYADQLVVVTQPAIDSARALDRLLEWLDQHSYRYLVDTAIVALNNVGRHTRQQADLFTRHFESRCRAVVTIPHDPTLALGGETSPDQLAAATRRAYLRLAAAVGEGFVTPGSGNTPGP